MSIPLAGGQHDPLGQDDRELCSAALDVTRFYGSAVEFNQTFNHGKPQPRPVWFRCVKRFKNLLQSVFIKPWSGIGNREREIAIIGLGIYLQAATLGHRVQRIEDKIQEDATDEFAVGPDEE